MSRHHPLITPALPVHSRSLNFPTFKRSNLQTFLSPDPLTSAKSAAAALPHSLFCLQLSAFYLVFKVPYAPTPLFSHSSQNCRGGGIFFPNRNALLAWPYLRSPHPPQLRVGILSFALIAGHGSPITSHKL